GSQGATSVLPFVGATCLPFRPAPFFGKRKRPLGPLYGIERNTGARKCPSSSSGRLTVRLRNNSVPNAKPRPKSKPPTPRRSATLFRIFVMSEGGEARCTALIFGIFDGSKASSTRAFC